MAESDAAGKSSTSKKSTAKKTTKKSAPRKRSAPRAEAPRRLSGGKVAEEAVRQLGDLTGRDIEGVTGLERTDDGWRVEVEVLELQRIPSTTDVLATYEIELDSSGELDGYRRTRRYVRGQAEGES